MDKKKVLIVEDEQDWVTILTSLLESETDIEVVAAANDRETALQIVSKGIQLDVVLMDINLSGNKCDGIYAALEIREMSNSKIIMLTSLEDKKIISDSYTAGVHKYVKKSDYMKIAEAIREVCNDNSPLNVLIEDYGRLKEQEQLKELNNNEKELFKLISNGYSRKQIEGKLNRTENTLKKQIKQILKKLDVKSSKEAILKVRRRGLYP